MDNFKEQLVKQEASGKIYFLRGTIIAAELCLLALLAVATMLITEIMSLSLLLAIGSFFLLKYLLDNTIVEYEYIVTNNDFDVDKIIGRRKRRRLITISLSNVEEIGEYKGDHGADASATVLATDGTGVGMWYMLAKHSEYGKILVVFTPNDAILDTMNPALPYSIRMNRKAPSDEE